MQNEDETLMQSQALSHKADGFLFCLFLTMSLIGLIAVASASYFLSYHSVGWGEYYAVRQGVFFIMSLGVTLVAYLIPTHIWRNVAPLLLFAMMILLAIVLIPGVGKSVNGSQRWLHLGVNFQVSEMAKLSWILYLASYVYRKQYLLVSSIVGTLVPVVVLAVLSVLILMEPDFGSVFLVVMIGFSMLFFAGMPWRYVFVLSFILAIALTVLAFAAPYRLARLTSFFDPWSNPFGDGYQLTQSLMAIGRGGLTGVGLGFGLQKQLYLPEAHTDFIFAVVSEELGYVGAMLIAVCFLLLVLRCMFWTYKAVRKNMCFEALTIYGMMVWWSLSALFSMCVNLGLVPTKGIALPFISYGGSNLLVNACAFGILLRMTKEIRQEQ